MTTMPLPSPTGQPDRPFSWFLGAAGAAVLDSEKPVVLRALDERAGQGWLWLGPTAQAGASGHGLMLHAATGAWEGAVHCALPLPLASESLATVVIQHVASSGEADAALLAECARVLVPGGHLWLFALNPLAPYRWRWRGTGLRASEPLTWRRRLRTVGLAPDPVSRGVGPMWRVQVQAGGQDGPGLRAAYVLHAERRTIPLTPVRRPAPLRIAQGAPAT